jgi:uncharacterized membrane protein YfcA
MPLPSPDLWALLLGAAAGLVCSFLNTVASSGSAVSLPILMMLGLDPISANATNRIPVLIGAASATASFHKSKAIRWDLALRMGIPVTAGAIIGAALAEAIPARDLALVITAAVLLALLLLFTKLKQAIASATPGEVRFGLREFGLFFLIGIWLGFIVLDAGTYLLLALVLAVHLSLVAANALKNVALLPTTAAAMAIFAFKGSIDWPLGAAMALGSIAGGVLGARLAISASAKKWIFRLLVTVITAELVHIGVHYVVVQWQP